MNREKIVVKEECLEISRYDKGERASAIESTRGLGYARRGERQRYR